ncbi:hypothetical protein ASB57_30015 [Bordetella sp. N]|nr:hypothetical protein ASB57_30015 [Bordetella sp. N]
MGNPPEDGRYVIAEARLRRFAYFSFASFGYVNDGEKIDATALYIKMLQGQELYNDRRRRLGLPVIFGDGWQIPPHYDQETRRLEWGVKLHDDQGNPSSNYIVRILGRHGVMTAALVTHGTVTDNDIAALKAILATFTYHPGENYADFRAGDKVAKSGLAALVLGDADPTVEEAGTGTGSIIGQLFSAAWFWLIAGAGACFMVQHHWRRRRR